MTSALASAPASIRVSDPRARIVETYRSGATAYYQVSLLVDVANASSRAYDVVVDLNYRLPSTWTLGDVDRLKDGWHLGALPAEGTVPAGGRKTLAKVLAMNAHADEFGGQPAARRVQVKVVDVRIRPPAQ